MRKEVVGCVQAVVGKKKFPVLFEYGQEKEIIKVYWGDFQGTLKLVRAPRAQAKKIENKNLGFFLRYLPNYCAAQCLVGFMTSFFCRLIGSSAT